MGQATDSDNRYVTFKRQDGVLSAGQRGLRMRPPSHPPKFALWFSGKFRVALTEDMNRPVKIILYVICITAGIWFGVQTRNHMRQAGASSKTQVEQLDQAASTENTQTARGSNQSISKLVTYGLLCCVAWGGFAFLLAHDLSRFAASRAEQAFFNDDGAPLDPEYEQAEELWKDGKHLEAVQALREYLGKNPREQHVALRIAEIYEENLNNPLAAALEYEEVLKKNLPAERWGWAAIHLANLYAGKLNQPEKATAILRRIDSEYGQTSAANKARQRLAQLDPNFVSAAAAAEIAAAAAEESSRPVSNLPPGFRPKQ